MLSRHLPTWHIIRGIATQAKVEPRLLLAVVIQPIFGLIPVVCAFCTWNTTDRATLFAILLLWRTYS
ncbi:MAG: hypothetical protein CMM07_07500 [Rhodopirellula sp.]|nr:hypothetical protein [Rhodopirellula sp.]